MEITANHMERNRLEIEVDLTRSKIDRLNEMVVELACENRNGLVARTKRIIKSERAKLKGLRRQLNEVMK